MKSKKERKNIIKAAMKEKEQYEIELAELEIILRDDDQLHWQSRRGRINYTAKIDGTKLYLTRDEGSRESYGEKALLGRHFLEKKKWQDIVKENFGDEIFDEIRKVLILKYEELKH